MPSLRFDYSTSDWVIFAPLRKFRPQRDASTELAGAGHDGVACCPFCPGNESLTPQEIFSLRTGGGSDGWQVRVVPNKFPALMIEEEHARQSEGPMFHFMGGCGAHEVIIESPDHEKVLAQQPVEQVERVLETARLRSIDLLRDPRFQTVVVFKNHGLRAGTSLAHPHWQIIATPVVPRLLRMKHAVAAEYFDREGISLYERMLSCELADGRRLVEANSEFVAFLPYAAPNPFETWIMPRRKEATFSSLRPEQRRPLAEILRSVLLRLYSSLENPDFNLTIDTASRGDETEEAFRWHLRVLPRLTTPAGFELGSGMAINTVLPEEAAKFLRDGDGMPAEVKEGHAERN